MLARIRRGQSIQHFETIRQPQGRNARSDFADRVAAAQRSRADRRRLEDRPRSVRTAPRRAGLESARVAPGRSAAPADDAGGRLELVARVAACRARDACRAEPRDAVARCGWLCDVAPDAGRLAHWAHSTASRNPSRAASISTYRSAPAGDAPFAEPMIVTDVMAEPMLEKQRDAYAAEGDRLAVGCSAPDRRGHVRARSAAYYRKPHHFSEVEIETARALGNLVSAAITTAELYDAQRRSREQSDLLAAATDALAGSLDYREPLRRIARAGRAADGRLVCGRSRSARTVASSGWRWPMSDSDKVERARQLQETIPARSELLLGRS